MPRRRTVTYLHKNTQQRRQLHVNSNSLSGGRCGGKLETARASLGPGGRAWSRLPAAGTFIVTHGHADDAASAGVTTPIESKHSSLTFSRSVAQSQI